MIVTMFNARVPVWKLKIGTVVGTKWGEYGHINGFKFVNEEDKVVTLEITTPFKTREVILSTDVVWLEN